MQEKKNRKRKVLNSSVCNNLVGRHLLCSTERANRFVIQLGNRGKKVAIAINVFVKLLFIMKGCIIPD